MPILHRSHTYNLDTTSGTLMCTFSFLLLIASIKSPEYLYFFIAQMYLEYFMIILEYLKNVLYFMVLHFEREAMMFF